MWYGDTVYFLDSKSLHRSAAMIVNYGLELLKNGKFTGDHLSMVRVAPGKALNFSSNHETLVYMEVQTIKTPPFSFSLFE